MTAFTKQVSLHGQRLYLTTEDELVVKKAVVIGGERSTGRQGGNIVLPGPNTVAHFDDFLGDLISDELQYFEGDTGHSSAIAVATNGVFRITFSSTAAKTSAAVAGVNGGFKQNWKANQGQLRMCARLKLSALNGSQNVFVGFTDTGGTEMPFYDTGGGVISTATNGVGFVFGGSASAATTWSGVGVKADVDGTRVAGTAPTANTYDVLEVIISDSGSNGSGDVAHFYQNGVLKGRMTNPVTTTTALYPVIAGFARDTGAWTLDIDYFNVSANRDTGT